jgi:hypothetical protein
VSDAAAATILDPADHEQPEVSGGAAGDRAIAGIVQPKITWVRQAEDRDIGEPPGSRHAASGKAEHASGVHRTRSRMPVKILSASRVSSEVMTRPGLPWRSACSAHGEAVGAVWPYTRRGLSGSAPAVRAMNALSSPSRPCRSIRATHNAHE